MAKKRGNPNWGKPELNTIPYTGATSFEEIARKLCLSPQQYGNSAQLKEQGSQIRATRFARIMGFRSQRIVVMFPMRTWTWSIVHSYGLAAVVGWFRSKLPTGAAVGIPLSQPAS
jgi:hypothetical protein